MPGRSGHCSRLPDELRFQTHGAEAVDLAVDVVVGVDQADVAHFRADLHDATGALELEILDDSDRVAVVENIAGRVLPDPLLGGRCLCFLRRPLVRALRADEEGAIFVGVLGLAFWTRGQRVHDTSFKA